jgi:hypothetical protein
MTRFSIQLPDNLNTWLDQQAMAAQRTKNGEIVAILEQAMSKTARQFVVYTGHELFCVGSCHYFKCDVPMENEECNCGKVRW